MMEGVVSADGPLGHYCGHDFEALDDLKSVMNIATEIDISLFNLWTLYTSHCTPIDGSETMMAGGGRAEHTFSIEMKSMDHLRNVYLSNESHEGVLLEGSLGKLEGLSFVEGAVLEVRGSNGVLRVEIGEAELMALLPQRKGDVG